MDTNLERPEGFGAFGAPRTKTDTWCLGCVLWECATRLPLAAGGCAPLKDVSVDLALEYARRASKQKGRYFGHTFQSLRLEYVKQGARLVSGPEDDLHRARTLARKSQNGGPISNTERSFPNSSETVGKSRPRYESRLEHKNKREYRDTKLLGKRQLPARYGERHSVRKHLSISISIKLETFSISRVRNIARKRARESERERERERERDSRARALSLSRDRILL